jgi:hypothetical protein
VEDHFTCSHGDADRAEHCCAVVCFCDARNSKIGSDQHVSRRS